MCGITGIVQWNADLMEQSEQIKTMTNLLSHRGPDHSDTWVSSPCAFGHRRLSVIDTLNGAQPMRAFYHGTAYTIVYNGEIYNALELQKDLEQQGHRFDTQCDTEVLLKAYIHWGPDCLDRLNGIYAFAIWDSDQQHVFLARDRLGVKPLFYSHQKETFVFGSEPKAILAHPDVEAVVHADGLAEVFIMGPARTPGHGIYASIQELKPGQAMIYSKNGLRTYTYWKLESVIHEDDLEQTKLTIRTLLQDTVERQLRANVPVCCLLSGGLDSSAITALAVNYYNKTGKGVMDTFSVDYINNDQHFHTHIFQPERDELWVHRMVKELGTNHHDIKIDNYDLLNTLHEAVVFRDLPGMADIDSSLYLFCQNIKQKATVALSGEGADELFGGYPWFHREEMVRAKQFPWSNAPETRTELLSPEIREWIKPQQYLAERYAEALAEVPTLKSESAHDAKMRVMSYINLTRFMPTLLDRKDRMSMGASLEVRVPYCDHRLVEYVWNIPWEMKKIGGYEKGILRQSLEGFLPQDVLYRKKSPYPKTYDPQYLEAVKKKVLAIVDDPCSSLSSIINKSFVLEIAASPKLSSDMPWFGQLMSGPQLLAYLIQVEHWLKTYRVAIR